MPRKPLDYQHRGRFVRHLHSDNHYRKMFKHWMAWPNQRYQSLLMLTLDWVIIRNPRMKPLLKNGRKHVQQ